MLSCKLLAATRETKLTLNIALNPKSKLTLEVATPTRRAFSGDGGDALTWRSHGHSVAAYL